MAGIPETIIDQVRDKTNIVEVIGHYLSLKRAGRNLKARCPFHHEKTASFMVSPAKQIFHCFGCGAGGNVFNFLMKYERVDFPEAVRSLAEKAGVDIPVSTRASSETISMAQRLHQVNELAANFYKDNLLRHEQGKAPKEYLEKRGMHREIIEKFKIGYALKTWEGFTNFAKQKGVPSPILERSGLALKKNGGSFYDRFRHRIMFPILDIKGKVRGFGGRILDEGGPKYMNSPETPVYNKGSHLYGLNYAWEDIRKQNYAVIVEGYLDLLTPVQHGINNIVASLGTALTVDQVKLLKRFTDNLVVLFDSDQAGEQATLRSLDIIIQEDMRVKVVQLPKGFDPDSFIHKYGKERFQSALNNAKDLFDYKLDLFSTRFDPGAVEGKAKIAGEILPTIAKIKNAILKTGYLKRLADGLSIDEASLRTELAKVKPDYSYQYEAQTEIRQRVSGKAARSAEKILAGLMIDNNAFISLVKENLGTDDFKDPSIKKVIDSLFKFSKGDKSISPGKLISSFETEEMGQCISEIIAVNESLIDPDKSLEDCIKWIKQNNLKDRLRFLQDQIKNAQNARQDDKVIELVTKYNDLIKESRT